MNLGIKIHTQGISIYALFKKLILSTSYHILTLNSF